jgi:hypothetical protein
MTRKERNLLLGVAMIISITLTGRFVFHRLRLASPSLTSNSLDLKSAYRLVASRGNIEARYEAAHDWLRKLEGCFITSGDLEKAKLELLKTVEEKAVLCGLAVHSKSAIQVSDHTIGIILEGETSPATLTRFLYASLNYRYALKIKRFQVHSLPEKATLSYQLVLTSVLVEKEGKAM